MKKQANIKDSLIELYLMLKPRKETKVNNSLKKIGFNDY